VCRRLKENPETASIPIIFISARDDIDAKVEAFRAGGVDYVTKPFANEEVVARVRTHLQLNDYQHNLEKRIEEGLAEIRKLNEELEETQDEMIRTLGALMEKRDDETGQHVVRVAEFSKRLAELYGLDEETVKLIYKAAPLHDAGKVAIPDAILNKPGAFTPEEWEIMKTHSMKGYEIFKDSTRPILKMAATIAKEHHEQWDGHGYPDGLKGEAISIAGRIVFLADVFDALSHKRVYKEAWSLEKVRNFIVEQRGKMFDPRLVDLFLDHFDEFVAIRDRFQNR
jgi:putative two-component system response regulator